jgi:diguanylate cyclase (GGDEF)-like protein
MSDKISEMRSHPAKYRFERFIKGPQDKIKALKEESRTDIVTGLPNEKALFSFMNGLNDLFLRDISKEVPHKGSFIVLDLTGLHQTNDKYGRNAGGDDYLKAVANSLTTSLRPEDRCFRLGSESDEFVLHLHEVDSRDELNKIMDRIDEKLNLSQEEHQTKYPGIEFGVSYAIASYRGGYDPESAYNDAANRLGEAKESKNGKRVGNVGRLFVN